MFFESQVLKWSERVTKLRFLWIWQKSSYFIKTCIIAESKDRKARLKICWNRGFLTFKNFNAFPRLLYKHLFRLSVKNKAWFLRVCFYLQAHCLDEPCHCTHPVSQIYAPNKNVHKNPWLTILGLAFCTQAHQAPRLPYKCLCVYANAKASHASLSSMTNLFLHSTVRVIGEAPAIFFLFDYTVFFKLL